MPSEEHSEEVEVEDRYFHIQIIAKENEAEGRTLDTFWEHIEDFFPECNNPDRCDCGIESFGGGSGTLAQAFRSHGIADDIEEVNPADVRIVLDWVDKLALFKLPELKEASARLRAQIDWWPNVLKSIAEEPDCEWCGANHDCAVCDPEFYVEEEFTEPNGDLRRWEDDGGPQLS